MPNTQISDVYAAASAVVMTSYHFDNQPMVVAEAIAHGRGVVLLDERLTELVDGGAARYTSQPTAASLGRSMIELSEHPEQLGHMAKVARHNRQRYSHQARRDALIGIYQYVAPTRV